MVDLKGPIQFWGGFSSFEEKKQSKIEKKDTIDGENHKCGVVDGIIFKKNKTKPGRCNAIIRYYDHDERTKTSAIC